MNKSLHQYFMKMKVNYVLVLSLAGLLIQCSPARMALQEDTWSHKEEYPVQGKRALFSRERMQFGGFQTTQVKRSWIKGTTSRYGLGEGNVTDYDYTNIISLDYIKRKQTVKFALTDTGSRESE